jgi:hypothetical protein
MAVLSSFLLDCVDSSELDYLTEICGDEAFLIYIRLRQQIHSEGGYYCNWNKEKYSPQLFLKRRFSSISKIDLELIETVIDVALDNDIFDRGMYEKYHILTSKEIQENYIQAVARRKNAEIKPEFRL